VRPRLLRVRVVLLCRPGGSADWLSPNCSARRSSTRSVSEGSVDGGSGRRRGLEVFSSAPISLFRKELRLRVRGACLDIDVINMRYVATRSRQVAHVMPLERKDRLRLLHRLEHRFERSGGMQLLLGGLAERVALRPPR
jgi:hypothetical protein